MYRWIGLIACLLVAGCGSTNSPEALRDKVQGEVVSTLKNYDEMYTLIDRQIRSCHSGGDLQIRSALYTDRDRGAIAVKDGEVYKILIEIFKSPAGYGSQISVHSQDDGLGEQVQSWIQGNSGCEPSVSASR